MELESKKSVKKSLNQNSSKPIHKLGALPNKKESVSDLNADSNEDIDSLNSTQLKSFSNEIMSLAEKALKYHNKRLKIKLHIGKYSGFLQAGKISQSQYTAYVDSFLRGYEEYKVYEMYDNYIKSQVEKMRSFSDAIFNQLENLKIDIPIDVEAVNKAKQEAEAEKQKIQASKNKQSANQIKKKAKPIDEKLWQNKADSFVKKKKKVSAKKVASDIFKKGFAANIFKKKQAAPEELFTKKKDKANNEKAKFSDKASVVASMFFGKKKKSVFDKGRKPQKKRVNKFLAKHKSQDDILGQKTILSDKFKNLRRIKIEADEDTKASFGLLSEHSKSSMGLNEIAKEKSKKESVTYNAESYSAIANILMKDFSLEFINSFPDFFKGLYRSLRLANIKILSSSYTNMMMLSSVLGLLGGSLILGLISMFSSMPLPMVVSNAALGGIFGGAIVFAVYYIFPQYTLKNRDSNLRSNLPFAIDHMAAIVGAGVSPTAMFGLISQSKDYGEVSVELEKIVEYVELFGYDLIAAMSSVSLMSPAKSMKEFLEGFTSTIESGGDLKKYLREKADGSMLQYKLERQRYTESISTFSDIYTGIMVASPLFFVAVLSLVSILGGEVGGMDITTLMLLGTYLAIPLLNLLFIVFMEATQPNI